MDLNGRRAKYHRYVYHHEGDKALSVNTYGSWYHHSRLLFIEVGAFSLDCKLDSGVMVVPNMSGGRISG